MKQKIRVSQILSIILALVLLTGISDMVLNAAKSTEDVMKKVLIVADPGMSGFTKKIAVQIGDTLKAKGYACEIIAPAALKKKDLSQFGWFVFGGPTYAGQVGSGLVKGIESVPDFKGAKTLAYMTGAGELSQSLPALVNLLKGKNADVVANAGFITKDSPEKIKTTIEMLIAPLSAAVK